MQFEFHEGFIAQDPPLVTETDAEENLLLTVHDEHLRKTVGKDYWEWLDSLPPRAHVNANMNIVPKAVLEPYYCKTPLWGNKRTYGIAAPFGIGGELTIIGHDYHTNSNVILLSAGAM